MLLKILLLTTCGFAVSTKCFLLHHNITTVLSLSQLTISEAYRHDESILRKLLSPHDSSAQRQHTNAEVLNDQHQSSQNWQFSNYTQVSSPSSRHSHDIKHINPVPHVSNCSWLVSWFSLLFKHFHYRTLLGEIRGKVEKLTMSRHHVVNGITINQTLEK